MTQGKKFPSKKEKVGDVARNDTWTIVHGRLTEPDGDDDDVESLFKFIGEKIPFEFLKNVRKHFNDNNITTSGVYIAHDSMGYPRYIGRGDDIFGRLSRRKTAQTLELYYFSFFVVKDKKHEREIETIMIRGAGPLLDFNDRKVRNDIQAGNAQDFEHGTGYIERQYKKGRKPKPSKAKSKIFKDKK